VLVIEHHLDVIKAGHVIDLDPDGGHRGIRQLARRHIPRRTGHHHLRA